MTKSYKRIGAIKTTFDILEHLSAQTRAVTAKEVADALRLPYGTVMSHIATLTDGGYVVQAGEGLKIGPRMALFALRLKAELERKHANIEQMLSLMADI